MEAGRRLIQSVLPSRMSSTRQDSRPTTLLGTGAPTRSDFIDTSIPEPGYDHYSHSAMQNDPSTHHPAVRIKPELVEASDRLASFRTLVGIDNGPALTTGFYSDRPEKNIGIYERVCLAESSSRTKYRAFSLLINVCLGLQLVVAAALTALGAGNGPHKLVTALGGINTVIAGLMTYLKGSGFPHRLKYYEQEWTKVRELIEQTEREFCREGCMLSVEEEVEKVIEKFQDVKGDIETNSTEGIMSTSAMQRKIDAQGQKPKPGLSRGMSYMSPPQPSQYHASGQYATYPPERAMSPSKETAKEKEKEVSHMV
jgi:hypothetical protein